MGEKRTLRRARTEKNRQKTVESPSPEAQEQATPEMLTLQRTIGNHQMNRMIEQNTLPTQTPIVQRAKTGIRTATATNQFTQAVFDYCHEPSNQAKTLADFK